jgi:Gene product 88
MKTIMLKKDASMLTGGLTQTSKMPCKSYSLPTEACRTGFKMSKIAGSVCSVCYANNGFYLMYQNTIKPAQFARLDSLNDPAWTEAMVALIGSDQYFRWHDSGDLQGLEHFEKIVQVAKLTPKTRHWLPTREYSIIKNFIAKGGKIPENLIVRLSGMYPDKPVQVPASLQGIKGITTSNVHTKKPLGLACKAPSQAGECRDCRACWTDKPVSYLMH